LLPRAVQVRQLVDVVTDAERDDATEIHRVDN